MEAKKYIEDLMENLKNNNPGETEFLAAALSASISFCVAQGSAISHLIDQIPVHPSVNLAFGL